MSKLLDELNPSQREAVTHKDGPLLIIAGPGSGKTRTVVHSIAYAIENFGVVPGRIVAFTFTRKAIAALKNQVGKVVGRDRTNDIWISTFHSFCGSILRRDIETLGTDYTQDFTILEESNQIEVVEALTRAQINYTQHHKFTKTSDVLGFIRSCKARDICPMHATTYAPYPQMSQVYVEIYRKYEQYLEVEGAIDYEGLQLFTNALFKDVPEVKTKWQEEFDLIFVDEYQDTDPVQYRIIKALAEEHQNLRVVGDDDQGIYGWRGADLQNILNFEKDYSTAKAITLGQNYRSTQQIVSVSRTIANFNPNRRAKKLFTNNPEGVKVKHLHCKDDKAEVNIITNFISHAIQYDRTPSDFAVLCRLNSQVDTFAFAFKCSGIPYQIGDSSNSHTSGVSIMTIHKSKGLEFPNVFLAGVCKGLLPFSENQQDEERRLLYVAMTRAQNWLCLSSYDSNAPSNTNGRSPFLDHIPGNLLESIQLLEYTHIPPRPIKLNNGTEVSVLVEELQEYVDPLPIVSEIVLGIDPGKLDADNPNVGWSVIQKSSDGYTALGYATEIPFGTMGDKLKRIEHKINFLIASYSPDAIAVEKLQGASDEDFRGVAACVALVRQIANQNKIECAFYSPQDVKYAVTGNKNASKEAVQKAVKKVCNLEEIPEPHHSADAIAASLCYLRNHLNSSRLQWKKRRQKHFDCGCAYLKDEQYNEAIVEFKKALNIDPIFVDAHYGLGQTYLEKGDLEASRKSANEILRLNDNYQPARELLDDIKQAYYKRGSDYLNNERYGEAIAAFKETINKYPSFTAAHCGLGLAYFGQGELVAAEFSAKEALKLDDNCQPALQILESIKQKHCERGKGYFNQDDLVAAEKSVNEALRLDSNYQPARELSNDIKQEYYKRSIAYIEDKEYAKAIKPLLKARDIGHSNKEIHVNLGRAYYWIDEYDKAASCYQKATEIDPNDKTAYSNLGNAYYWMGEYNKAIKSLLKAKDIEPDCKKTRYYLGRTYFKLDLLEEAKQETEKALSIDPVYQSCLKLLEEIKQESYNCGILDLEKRNYADAVRKLKIVVDLDPNYKDVQNNFVDACMKFGIDELRNQNFHNAISLFKEVREIKPNRFDSYFYCGVVKFKLGQPKKAIADFNKSIRLKPRDVRVYYYRGRAKQSLKLYQDAILVLCPSNS